MRKPIKPDSLKQKIINAALDMIQVKYYHLFWLDPD